MLLADFDDMALGRTMGCDGNLQECKRKFAALQKCPDCDEDLGYPNVRKADEGRGALLARYDTARNVHSGKLDILNEFEQAVQQYSRTILTIGQEFLLSFLNSGNNLYATYHRQIEAGTRIAAAEANHQRRVEADNLMFGVYMKDITFCTLTMTATGAWSYGDYHVTLKTGMVEKRIAFTQHNTFAYQKWFKKEVRPDGSEHWAEQPGFRSSWETRAKLAVAKHAEGISGDSHRADFGAILLGSDGDRASEEFIEGHIFSSLTRRTFESVRAPTDDEFRGICGRVDLRMCKRERRSVEQKLKALKSDGVEIAFQCGD